MSTKVGGPMFEPAKSQYWESVECPRCRMGRDGGHYNVFGCRDEDGMAALRAMFPTGEANEFNLVLFSTSGVHGMYTTIEEVESPPIKQDDTAVEGDDDNWVPTKVTFLVVHPRIVALRYGNCIPQTSDDFAFLKRLRETSWKVFQEIGKPE